jgi:RNA polymerase sigma-70 factor (ECF subfamily)
MTGASQLKLEAAAAGLLRSTIMDDQAPGHPGGMSPEESSLLARLQAGDQDAFAACVNGYCGRLLVVTRRILENEEDARDAVQDAFLSAFQAVGRFEGRSGLGTWLHRIAVNAALGRLRSRRRSPENSIEDLLPHFGDGEHQLDPPVPWKETSPMIVEQQESRELVRRCINQLPETYRTVLVLRDIEELDTQETAEMLGTSPGIVKTRVHRARQALRTLLDPYFRRDLP